MASKKTTTTSTKPKRVLNARRDTLDFRDRMYIPPLVEVPTRIPLEDYWAYEVPILDQGQEGACTGFGLATVANYLLRRRKVVPDTAPVSPRMLYDMARRYDEWPGEGYSGSSARGAMKGWHKHGVCAEASWPYALKRGANKGLTQARVEDAQQRPLGAYFRVNHKDLVAMHAALAEVGVLYATSMVHGGWDEVGANGFIKPRETPDGGHAFAIVAYDTEGFWIQNSWGPDWGRKGFARIAYDDWLRHATDVWVARLGAPIRLATAEAAPAARLAAPSGATKVDFATLRPHVVSVGNEGRLRPGGEYGMNEDELATLFAEDLRRTIAPWPKKRVLLYAHGGLVSEQSALQRLAEYRPALLSGGVYPLAFIWKSDYWSTITNILQDAVRRRRPEGAFDAAKDFLLDRLDDLLEPVARGLTGKAAWDEMKENALAASNRGGAAALVVRHLAALAKEEKGLEIHLVGHSAGSILLAPVVGLLAAAGLKISTCTLWAPACTVELFKRDYLPAIKSGRIQDFATYVLDDQTERDDNCAKLYNKSLLYLVSNAFEARQRIPMVQAGTPVLGLQRCIEADAELSKLFASAKAGLVLAPDQSGGREPLSGARHHGDFDDDPATVRSTFARILDAKAARLPALQFGRSAASLRELRQQLELKSR
ncbi:C1 family peptidase [Roseateles sp. DAIF2]|uniref:C1 family peptidase n=1 Tax=Roseateles sp. DAIF2 TaxID=2714952 RepID=UPI0018A2E793|nr:C1 family peptidase [Roseateles sp. DAIF2]QPF72458.1 C1 family peptidase [Roseateles sp. DAIF2]